MKKKILFFLLVSLPTSLVFAEDVPAPTFRIAVEVTVVDDGLRERMTRYLTNELELLGDVAVTSENPDFKLYAMVMQVRTSDDRRMAYVLGVSVATFFPDGYFDTILRADLSNADEVKRKLEEVTVYRNQFLSLAGPTETNLQEIAGNAVTKLNSHILRLERRANETDQSGIVDY